MCVSEGLQVRRRGSGKGTELSLLCCFVLLRGRAQQKGENPNYLSALPSFRPPPPPSLFTHLLIRPCWMGKNSLEGEESHTDRWTTVWRCLSNREGERAGERNGESGPPECHPRSVSPVFPFLFFGSRSPFSPVWWQWCPVCSLEKRSQCLRDSLTASH